MRITYGFRRPGGAIKCVVTNERQERGSILICMTDDDLLSNATSTDSKFCSARARFSPVGCLSRIENSPEYICFTVIDSTTPLSILMFFATSKICAYLPSGTMECETGTLDSCDRHSLRLSADTTDIMTQDLYPKLMLSPAAPQAIDSSVQKPYPSGSICPGDTELFALVLGGTSLPPVVLRITTLLALDPKRIHMHKGQIHPFPIA